MNRIVPCTLIALAIASTAHAAPSSRPGLWEVQTTVKMLDPETAKAMAQAQEAMKNLPPEQKKMMQEMLAKQGVQMGEGANTATTVKLCISEEMARRGDLPQTQVGNCKSTQSPRVNNRQTFEFTCSNPDASGSGEYLWQSDRAFRFTVTTRGKDRATDMDASGSGKWLSDDCGGIKPLE
jgi:hypothetical protein